MYRRAAVVVGAGREDFGLTVVEAALEGTPAATVPAGGYLATVRPGVSGVHAASATPDDLPARSRGPRARPGRMPGMGTRIPPRHPRRPPRYSVGRGGDAGVNESQVTVPLPVRLRFGHAAVQRLAEEIGVDLLHIKGAAVDPSLRPSGYAGSDVDVLVRPAHVLRLDRAMRQHGWRLYSTFEYGSPFGHAQTYFHDAWGYIDLHRFFPGIRLEPERAFDVFWSDRHEIDIAAVGCLVPGVPAQAVLLVLNAARAPRQARSDVSAAWRKASDEQRREIAGLVGRLTPRSPSPPRPGTWSDTSTRGTTACGRSSPRAAAARRSGGRASGRRRASGRDCGSPPARRS